MSNRWTDQVEFAYSTELAYFSLRECMQLQIEQIDDPVLASDGQYVGPCHRVTIGNLFGSNSWYIIGGLETALRFASAIASAESKGQVKRFVVQCNAKAEYRKPEEE